MHSYSVQLRISGETLDPEYVSNLLALQPNMTRLKGEARGRNGAWAESLWSYGGNLCEVSGEWEKLEDGLLEIMEELWSKKSLIRSLEKDFKVIWWCGHYQSSFDGGPIFSVALLQRLAEFGVPLYLDNYFRADGA
jgi:hypothetical protein